MGEMDLKHNEYFESNIRFADDYNGILFGGKQIIKPEELKESDSVFVQLFEKKKEWKFAPVVPLVIYLGKEQWDAASTLYELTDIEDILKPFINNYRLNLYDYHNETDSTKFKTENKYLFKLLYYSDDKEKIKQILNDVYNDDSLSIYVDKILLNTIGVSFDLETIIEIKNGKERVKMIKALEDIRNEGKAEGMDIGYLKALKENVDSLMKSLNITLEQALDTLNIDNEIRKNFYS